MSADDEQDRARRRWQIPVTGARASETIYEHAGGEDGLREIVELFYSSIFETWSSDPSSGIPSLPTLIT